MIQLANVNIPPSEAPAADLPELEPTVADLLALDTWCDDELDDRMHGALLLAAHEHTHRELMALRHQLTITIDSPSPWRAAA
ncbi:hypothetical protein [Prauserella endophytica]|uniref:HNH endonuclease n=1 Tax=Prauserella endophytica TaxID=1592324 RepID=A0ABY2RV28_9PSEU|nr:hypothetical protein [Prauserella endophytica]TKG61566.1 hypothetical protein FCN18_33550 [Prauserella endophytica]